jgi:photosystem II oxygen-evolving enhancer protein 2
VLRRFGCAGGGWHAALATGSGGGETAPGFFFSSPYPGGDLGAAGACSLHRTAHHHHASLPLLSRSPSSPSPQHTLFILQATNTTGFIPYSGDGFALLLPSKWNPRRQEVTPGVVLTYEDNGDAVNHVDVIARKASASSIDGYGAPDKFLNEVVRPLLGEQVFAGETRSEGGFGANKVAAASLLDVQEAKDAKGKVYYKYNILTRTADGNEGGRHHLVAAAVGNGNLYIAHATVGDKRWFKGVDKDAIGMIDSFTVA